LLGASNERRARVFDLPPLELRGRGDPWHRARPTCRPLSTQASRWRWTYWQAIPW